MLHSMKVVTLTTYITNLNLTDSWKGTTRHFLCHLKEKLRLLDSLVLDTDKIPETVRITCLQRAVQQNHDLRQIHVLDSVWRSKTGSTENLLLKSIMTCFGMQNTSMTSTGLQDENIGRLSSHIKLVILQDKNIGRLSSHIKLIILEYYGYFSVKFYETDILHCLCLANPIKKDKNKCERFCCLVTLGCKNHNYVPSACLAGMSG